MKYLEIHQKALLYYRERAITNLDNWVKTHSMSEYGDVNLRLTLQAHFTAYYYLCPIHIAYYCFAKGLDCKQYSLSEEVRKVEHSWVVEDYNNLNKEWSSKEEKFLLKNFVINKNFVTHRRFFEAIVDL